MRRFPQLLTLATLFFVGGCATEPASSELTGSWRTAPEDLSPAGWYHSTLLLAPKGIFRAGVESYGLYPGQERSDLSAYSIIEGSYNSKGGRLSFQPRRLIWWDSFYGAASPEHVEEPYQLSLYDDARYTVLDDHLLLRYLSYPFDAPVETLREFVREN